MNFEEYQISEAQHLRPINETWSKIGETSIWKGDNFCGAHHHKYVIWAAVKGDGWTGVGIPEVDAKMGVGSHQHMIVNGQCLEAQGHTHDLKTGKMIISTEVGTDTATVPVSIVDDPTVLK